MTETIDLKRFIENSKEKFKGLENLKIIADKLKFNGLISGYSSLVSAIDRYEKELASDYNIFRVLKNIHYKEVITHSPFMADLLNINGKHKQGDLFYKEFLNLLQIGEKQQLFTPTNKNLFFVEIEKSIGYIDDSTIEGGRIDILITYRDKEKQFAIAIENKIYANDQWKQLQRYQNYLKLVHQPNFILVYLTKHKQGFKIPYSIDQQTFDSLKSEMKIINICYKPDIINLITKSLNSINAQNIRAILTQYLQILNTLK